MIESHDENTDRRIAQLSNAVHQKMQQYGAEAIHFFEIEELLYYQAAILPTLCEHGGRRPMCAACLDAAARARKM